MRVLLRSTNTGLFYAGHQSWTAVPTEALDFKETSLALDAASSARLGCIELLMRFDEPSFEIPLAIVSLGDS